VKFAAAKAAANFTVNQPMKKNSRKLIVAMSCYGVLILAALYFLLPVRTSNDRFILGVVLLVLALLIIKTIAHSDDDGEQ
jgi:hypothetical protein